MTVLTDEERLSISAVVHQNYYMPDVFEAVESILRRHLRVVSGQEEIADLLAEHEDCITNCDIKTVGVRDGQMWYLIHWTCGMTSGPLTLGSTSISEGHRAHLAAVLAARETALREEIAQAIEALVVRNPFGDPVTTFYDGLITAVAIARSGAR